ncbi:MAG TPA: hypothetical protein VJ890_14045 [Vineibacter sp.]|nr:hypothetical protein [Vineibacter sp.]
MVKGLCAALLAGAVAGACGYSETETVVVPVQGNDACTRAGFARGTVDYDRCMSPPPAARWRAPAWRDDGRRYVEPDRVILTNTESAPMTNAQASCYAQGLRPGTGSYERCVVYGPNAGRYY